MINVSIGGSREGNTGGGGITSKEQASFSAHLHPPMLSMHGTYCYHREGPHTLYYNDRHALLFLSLSLSMIQNAPQIQKPGTAYDFSNIKKLNICESPIHQEASTKV